MGARGLTYLLFAIGLAGLFFGGELLVRGASSIARSFGLSPLVIGLTIVGFGTSAPELLVSVQAALADQPAIAIGNVLGSNIANILLILGISTAIAPLLIPARSLWRDLAFMIGASAAIWGMLLDGSVTRLEGLVLCLGLAIFLTVAFVSGKRVDEEEGVTLPPIGPAILMTLGGLVALVIGARFLVDSASTIARTYGISEAVIGLTVVAVGTSLPELATSVIAAVRKQTEIAVGNVLGSNVFNIFGILGVTALITPIPVDPRFVAVDMPWVMATAVGLALVAVVLGRLPRLGGVALMAIYAVYLLGTS